LIFPDTCILRALLVTLSLMRPKIAELITAVGLSNEGLLRTFLASNRKSKLTLSVTLNFFESEVSHWKYLGARKKLRPVFPIEPGTGAVKRARVAVSNQKFLPLSNTSVPLSLVQPLQSAVDWTTLLTVFMPE
jgi:hypothetical protein